jgi:hypothetical protein
MFLDTCLTHVFRIMLIASFMVTGPTVTLRAADCADTTSVFSSNEPVAADMVSVDAVATAVQSESQTRSFTTTAARIVKALFRAGIGAAGIAAILDAFSSRSGTLLMTEAGLGALALLAAFFYQASWETGNAGYVHEHHDCVVPQSWYIHEPGYVPVVIESVFEKPIETAIIEQQPTTPQPEQAVATPETATQESNPCNAEVTKFWNDPFNY